MSKIRLLFLCLFSLSIFQCTGETHQQDLLQTKDISKIMNQMFSEHVDKKEMSPNLIQHAVEIYISQFDPLHIYLLDSEVKQYLALTPQQLADNVEKYKKNNYSEFEELNQKIQQAILRARKLRSEIEKTELQKIFSQKVKSVVNTEQDYAIFPKDNNELKQRWLTHLQDFIDIQRSRFGETAIMDKKDQLIQTYEAKLTSFENQYLYLNQEGKPLPVLEKDNLFAIHVLKAMASSLDSHTSFYKNSEAFDIKIRLQKEFQGFGFVLKNSSEGIIVTKLIEGGPAAKSGLIKIGDILLSIDGQPTAQISFQDLMAKLRNEKQLIVKLTFKRPSGKNEEEQTYNVSLTRQEVELKTDRVDVSWENFGNGIIGKITLHAFYQGDNISSEKDVRKAIEQLKRQGTLRGLILDLRDNSGGFLTQAVKVGGLFITNGVIVVSKYSNGDEKIYRDVDVSSSYDGPLIVLTSKITASAAEIVAQALQDYGVAVVVGDEHTYGKGTIQTQTVTDNQSSSYFKVTVGKYYTVSGKTPQKQGVKADIVVPSKWAHEQVGEIYQDSVQPDSIHPEWNDDLSDVSPEIKSWYLKYYVPSLQHRTQKWSHLLGPLRKNSAYRISNNKNYQIFLTGKVPEENDSSLQLVEKEKNEKDVTFGVDDLQMQEAVNIVKDMIILESLEK